MMAYVKTYTFVQRKQIIIFYRIVCAFLATRLDDVKQLAMRACT